MMKNRTTKFVLFIVILSFSQAANAQLGKSVDVGYVDRFEKLPKLKFKKSNAIEYNRCSDKLGISFPKIEETDAEFVLQVKGKKNKFKKRNELREDFDGYYYLGYYHRLKMYAITENSVSENLNFGTFGLIDSITGKYYQIISIGDGPIETPIASVNSKYLIYYYNRLYDGDSAFIGLLKVNTGNRSKLTEKSSFDTNDWAVKE